LEQPRIVTPYSGKGLKINWKREDERKYDFETEIDELMFLKDDYKYFRNLELSENRCELQFVNVYLVCGGIDNLIYTGSFSMSSGKWDIDRCTVKFKIKTNDPYTCIDENDDDINIFKFNLNSQTVLLGQEIGLETFICYSQFGEPQCTNGLPPPYGLTFEGPTWTFVKEFRVPIFPPHVGSLYVRQYLLLDCNETPPNDWYLTEECTGGKKKYTKRISGDPLKLVDVIINRNGIDGYEAEIIYLQDNVQTIDNGMLLKDVMQGLLDEACSGYTIVSDFFQWNPENETDINYVTNELNFYSNLKLFQKSDVKRPSTTNNATKAETNFKELRDNILKIFNCGYKIIGNIFRIEHISWFERSLGINLLLVDNKMKFLKGTRQYSYDKAKLPKYEKFSFMESGSEDFVGRDIIYNSNCVYNDKDNKSDNNIDIITTDVLYVLQNPDSDSKNVEDDGFVLVACDKDNKIITVDGILTGAQSPNNVLGWAYLHEKFWKHGRVLKYGNLNGEDVEFNSIVPTIKQDGFGCVLSCNNIIEFNPLDMVKGALGWGYVQSAELTLTQCRMKFELLLEEILIDNLIETHGDFDDDFSEEFD